MKWNKRLLSACLSAALLLPCIPSLSADDGTGEYHPYRWEDAAEGDASRRLSDYSGAGTAIAVIDAGFDVSHPVFAAAPPEGGIDAATVTRLFGEKYYISEKLPFVYDYTDGDENVENISMHGTSAASIAAGFHEGKGDMAAEDGTVTRDPSYSGIAPHAQLLLMKAAADGSSQIDSACAARAIRDALRLGAVSVVLHTYGLTPTEELQSALADAHEVGVGVFCGAGDLSAEAIRKSVPVLYTDRSTLTDAANLSYLTLVGAAGDPYREIRTFTLQVEGKEQTDVAYTDSCEEYFGMPFSRMFAGQKIPVAWMEGVGHREEYNGIDVEGKLAVVKRGEISFVEKARIAAEAGAVGLIVVDQGDGVSRMALEGAPIPAVMITKEMGEHLADRGAVLAVFREVPKGLAAFSAAGLNDSLTATVSFVCDGEGLDAAVSAALSGDGNFSKVSGTSYAAAAAAGYGARCAQYCRRAGLSMADVLPLLTQSATPLLDADGDPLSPRSAGAGYVHDECTIPDIYLINTENAPLSACGNTRYWTTYVDLRVKNTTDRTEKYEISAAVFGDGWSEGILTGHIDPLTEATVFLGDSHRNIHTAAEEHHTPTLTLDPGEEASVYIRLTLPKALRENMDAVFANGYYVDGFVTLTDEAGQAVSHPFTTFIGDWSRAPLIDTTVYDDEDAMVAKTSLYVRRGAGAESSDSLIGVNNPSVFPGEIYDPMYNILRSGGKLLLSLSALRDIDEIHVTFRDSEGRVVHKEKKAGVPRSGRDLPRIELWDFTAADNGEYIFPDGVYTCEIRVNTSFGDLGSAQDTMNFTVLLDSVRPDVVSYSIGKTEDGILSLTVTAQDDRLLGNLFAYDGTYSYLPAGGMYACSGQTEITAVMDLQQYDFLDPLYIEVRDYAGNSRVIRLTPEQIRAALGEED